jgi:hypothetical protein
MEVEDIRSASVSRFAVELDGANVNRGGSGVCRMISGVHTEPHYTLHRARWKSSSVMAVDIRIGGSRRLEQALEGCFETERIQQTHLGR